MKLFPVLTALSFLSFASPPGNAPDITDQQTQTSAQSAGTIAAPPRVMDTSGSAWSIRCNKGADDKDRETGNALRQCEVFQPLPVNNSNQYGGELAISFPDKANRDTARAVLVLPLGIMNEDLHMQIDGGAAFRFRLRYCTGQGCISHLNLNKEVLDLMRGGNDLTIKARTLYGRDVPINLHLDGLNKALQKL